MHELYLWPFADAVRAGVGFVMCSYNKINGKYSCENGWTINALLKHELDFQGFGMSDQGAQHSRVDSALGGLVIAMSGDGGLWGNPYGSFWSGALLESVLNGLIPAWRVDDMAVHITAAFYKVTGNRTRSDINFSAWVKPIQADHAVLIREIGAKSAVLLKNKDNDALPLRRLKRRDISNWGSDEQNWVITYEKKAVFIGHSVADIALNVTLPSLN